MSDTFVAKLVNWIHEIPGGYALWVCCSCVELVVGLSVTVTVMTCSQSHDHVNMFNIPCQLQLDILATCRLGLEGGPRKGHCASLWSVRTGHYL